MAGAVRSVLSQVISAVGESVRNYSGQESPEESTKKLVEAIKRWARENQERVDRMVEEARARAEMEAASAEHPSPREPESDRQRELLDRLEQDEGLRGIFDPDHQVADDQVDDNQASEQETPDMSGTFRGVKFGLKASEMPTALKTESAKRLRQGQERAPAGEPVQVTDYASQEFNDAIGDKPVFVDPTGKATVFPPGSTPSTHPDTRDLVSSWSKDALVDRFYEPDSKVRRKDPDAWKFHGRPTLRDIQEWDHVEMTLSREAGASVTPEQMKAAAAIMTEVLRTHPNKLAQQLYPDRDMGLTPGNAYPVEGNRAVHMLPIHDNTNNVHVQAYVNRLAVDVNGREVGGGVDPNDEWVASTQVEAMNSLLRSNGIPLSVTNGFERQNKVAQQMTPEQQERAAARVAKHEGVTPPAFTQGMGTQLQGQTAPRIESPNASLIRTAYEADLALQERLEKEADQVAQRIAAQQHALSAIDQNESLTGQVETLTDNLSAMEERAASLETDLGASRDDVAKLKGELAAESERMLQAEERANQAENLANAREEEVERLSTHAAGEEARTHEAVSGAVHDALTPVNAELAQVREALAAETAAREAAQAELAQDRASFVDRAKAWAAENVAGPLIERAEKAEAALKSAQETITGFPARLEAEMTSRLEAMESRLQASFDRMMEKAEARFSTALEAKDKVIDGLRSAAAAPLAVVANVAGKVAEGAATTAEAVKGKGKERPGSDYASVPPGDWTEEQRKFATSALDHFQKTVPPKVPQGTSLDEFGQRVHDQWKAKNPDQQGQDGGATPPQAPGTTRKPK